MHIKKLKLNHFRNHPGKSFEFTDGYNCFYGANGAGKTNVLDALHFLSEGKSYFTRTDANAIEFDNSFALIEALLIQGDEDIKLKIGLERDGKKSLRRNGVAIKKLSDYIGMLPTIMITPGDIKLITGYADERRRFMDRMISHTDNNYLKKLLEHNKLLEARNEMLRQFFKQRHTDMLALESIDVQLAPLIEDISERRSRFVIQLEEPLQELYAQLTGAKESISLSLSGTVQDGTGLSYLKQNHQTDLFAQRTTQGIHKDDLVIDINGHSVRSFGSQGQVKSVTIAMYLAAYKVLQQEAGKKPLLLLDDIFEKIDDERSSQLLELISSDDYGQIFITDTSLDRLKSKLKDVKADKKFFNIERSINSHLNE